MLKYLITGTGRSGTVYLARVLTSLGIPCGHESIFDHHGVDGAIERLSGKKEISLSIASSIALKDKEFHPIEAWVDTSSLLADSSYMAAPFLKHPILSETKIIHAVRDPLKVVNSFCNYLGYFRNSHPSVIYGHEFERFMYNFVPELSGKMTYYERGCLYVILWNQMITNHLKDRKYKFWRVEDSLEYIFDYLEVSPSEPAYQDRTANTFKKNDLNFSLNQLPKGSIKSEFIRLMASYGYTSDLLGVKT